MNTVIVSLLNCNIHVVLGIAFYDDLNLPVVKAEALAILALVQQEAEAILPGTVTQLVGGFRRSVYIIKIIKFLQ